MCAGLTLVGPQGQASSMYNLENCHSPTGPPLQLQNPSIFWDQKARPTSPQSWVVLAANVLDDEMFVPAVTKHLRDKIYALGNADLSKNQKIQNSNHV